MKKIMKKETKWLKIKTWIDDITDNGKNEKVVASLNKYLTMRLKDIEEEFPEKDEDGIDIIITSRELVD